MNDFFAMGGYAPYVWGSFGSTVLVFAWNLASVALARREVLCRLRARAPERK